jgi:hypothetical protein
MCGELNPENTSTTYGFQYGACGEQPFDSCPTVSETDTQRSSVYGVVGRTVEVTGLQPSTVYRYRLFAKDSQGQQAVTETAEARFLKDRLKLRLSSRRWRWPGGKSGLSLFGAVVSGTGEPDGQAATYTFELGIYNGSETQYSVVFKGPAGAGPGP